MQQPLTRIGKGSPLTDLEFDQGNLALVAAINAFIAGYTPLPSIVPTLNGGTGKAQTMTGNRLIISDSTGMLEYGVITANRALISSSGGLPTASTVLNTELAFVHGVTSAIQTQLDGKKSNFTILPIANGGTALSTVPSNGQLLIGNGSGYSLATLIEGTNVTITNGSGTITINAAGAVTSVNAITGAILLATGTAGTDFGISQLSQTITFNIPTASSTKRGLVQYSGSSSQYVKGDGSLGGVVWGTITGSLGSQADLVAALAAKQDALTFSGTYSIQPTVVAGVVTMDLQLASPVAPVGYFSATNTIETDGLNTYVHIASSSQTGVVSSTDYNTKWFLQGTNSFGVTGVLGTADAFALNIKTNNVVRAIIASDGKVNIGTAAPSYLFGVQNELFYDGSNAFGLSKTINNGLGLTITNGSSGTTASAFGSYFNDAGKGITIQSTSSGFTDIPNVVKKNRSLIYSTATDGIHVWNETTGGINFWAGASGSEGQIAGMLATGVGLFDAAASPTATLDVYKSSATSSLFVRSNGLAQIVLNGGLTVSQTVSIATIQHFSPTVSKLNIYSADNGASNWVWQTHTQVGIGIKFGSVAPTIAASAILDIQSTTQGVKICPMTNTQLNAISSPAESLLVYDTTNHVYTYWNGSVWKVLATV